MRLDFSLPLEQTKKIISRMHSRGLQSAVRDHPLAIHPEIPPQ
jgi:hypothetical protein